jgi:hypothetical protein
MGKYNKYKLGTTLIFTSLTQASAAADLFGEKYMETRFSPETGCMGWKYGFDLNHRHWGKWRIALDTEEKLGWFKPQVGDLTFCKFYKAEDYIKLDNVWRDKLDGGLRGSGKILGIHRHVIMDSYRIIERDGKPFPTPQEVIEPEDNIVARTTILMTRSQDLSKRQEVKTEETL